MSCFPISPRRAAAWRACSVAVSSRCFRSRDRCLTNPKLLLLDEPNEGLAPTIIEEIIAAILKLKRERVAMLVSEQSLRTIKACGDRVVVIDRGRSVFHGTAGEFLGNPEIARQYLMVGH